MSLPEQEAHSLDRASDFLLRLGSGEYKVTSIRALRKEARDILKHYPLAAGSRWLERP